MKKDWKRHIAFEVLVILVMLTVLMYLCRLWPIIFLLIIGIFITALRLLFLSPKRVEVVEPLPLPALPEPKEPTEKDVRDIAYSVILRRITQLVHQRYPQARWIWESSNIRQLIENGEDVFILLNRAGGYRRAKVTISNLQVKDFIFVGTDTSETDEEPDIFEPDDDVPENYELLAFEWVEAHIIDINNRCNEAIGEGKNSVLIPADELPVKESWLDVCRQLEKVEIENSECIPEGIRINLTH